MPIARSAPAAVSPTEMAKDKRSILNSCHRDIGPTRLPAPDPNFGVARLHGDAVSLTRQTPRRGMPQIVSAARPAFTIDDPSCSSVRPFPPGRGFSWSRSGLHRTRWADGTTIRNRPPHLAAGQPYRRNLCHARSARRRNLPSESSRPRNSCSSISRNAARSFGGINLKRSAKISALEDDALLVCHLIAEFRSHIALSRWRKSFVAIFSMRAPPVPTGNKQCRVRRTITANAFRTSFTDCVAARGPHAPLHGCCQSRKKRMSEMGHQTRSFGDVCSLSGLPP
jgi:hypothetical protein